MKNSKYYKFLKQKEDKLNLDTKEIKSDFNLVFNLIYELFIFLVKLPFFLILAIFNFIVLNFEKSNEFLMKILIEPFIIISKIFKWFFEAKFTASLISFLIFMYILEFIVFIPLGIFDSLLFSSKDLFSSNFITIVTSIFLHANLTHILGNIIALLIFGRIVEKQFKSKMLLIFLFSAIVANIVSGFIYYSQNDFTPSLGASGGIAGLIIFAILLEPFAISSVFLIPLPIFILGWFLISLDITGLTNPSSTNNLAHISGYLTLVLMFFFLEFRKRKKIIKGFLINLIILILIYFLVNYYGINFTNIFFNNISF